MRRCYRILLCLIGILCMGLMGCDSLTKPLDEVVTNDAYHVYVGRVTALDEVIGENRAKVTLRLAECTSGLSNVDFRTFHHDDYHFESMPYAYKENATSGYALDTDVIMRLEVSEIDAANRSTYRTLRQYLGAKELVNLVVKNGQVYSANHEDVSYYTSSGEYGGIYYGELWPGLISKVDLAHLSDNPENKELTVWRDARNHLIISEYDWHPSDEEMNWEISFSNYDEWSNSYPYVYVIRLSFKNDRGQLWVQLPDGMNAILYGPGEGYALIYGELEFQSDNEILAYFNDDDYIWSCANLNYEPNQSDSGYIIDGGEPRVKVEGSGCMNELGEAIAPLDGQHAHYNFMNGWCALAYRAYRYDEEQNIIYEPEPGWCYWDNNDLLALGFYRQDDAGKLSQIYPIAYHPETNTMRYKLSLDDEDTYETNDWRYAPKDFEYTYDNHGNIYYQGELVFIDEDDNIDDQITIEEPEAFFNSTPY